MTNVHDILEKTRAAGARLQPSEAAVLFASAVRHAAAQGATVRPHLVQIDESGVLHVAPFDELAAESDPGYLAPELHAEGAPKKTEARVQVFAAGALGYELLTGQRASGLPPGPELKGPLADIVKLALAADRRERFADLKQLQDAVEVVQPRPPPEGERSILSGLRMRWSRPPPEKEALAKVIEKLQQLEEQVQLLGKAQGRLESAQRETAEHLERFTEGQARLGKTRSRGSILGPALLAAGLAVAGVLAAAWATGVFGPNAAQRPAPAPTRAEALPPPDPEPVPVPAKPAPTLVEPHAQPARPVPAADAGARMVAAADAAAESPPAAETAAGADDAGTSGAAAEPADAGKEPAAVVASPPPPKKAPPAPPPTKRAPTSTQAAMLHAVATSQVRRGEAALEQGHPEAALESFRAALENEANNARAFRGLGMAYAMQGNDQQALQAYDKYLRLAPNAADAREIRKSMAELRGRSR